MIFFQVIERQVSPSRPAIQIVHQPITMTINSGDSQSPTSPPTSPTQVTLAKAPTPWMQKQVKPQEELPGWARKSNRLSQDSSSSSEGSQYQQPTSSTIIIPQQPPRQTVIVTSKPQQQLQSNSMIRPVRQDSESRVPVPRVS